MSDPSPPTRSRKGPSLTTMSIAGVVLGFCLGLVANETGSQLLMAIGDIVTPVGRLWINALRALIVPMMVALLLTAIVNERRGESTGRITGTTMAIIACMLVLGATFSLLLCPLLVGDYDVDPAMLASLSAPQLEGELPDVTVAETLGQWVSSLIPRNPFQSAIEGNLLPLLLLTAAFGLAVNRAPQEQRLNLSRLFQALAGATMKLVHWILVPMPVAVFALGFSMAMNFGLEGAGYVLDYAILESGLCLGFMVVMYVLAVFVGGVRLSRFARAAAPSQAVAIGSRSSIASLPAMMEGAETLGLPNRVSGISLPLCVSVFKANTMLSTGIVLFFLGRLFDVEVNAQTVMGFVMMMLMISFTSPGIPGGGGPAKRIAAYMTIGIPPEGAILAEFAEVVSDIFRTLLNVTADLTVAVLATRFTPGEKSLTATAPEGLEPQR